MSTLRNIPHIHLSTCTDQGPKGKAIEWYNCEDEQYVISYENDHEFFMRKADCDVLHNLAVSLYDAAHHMVKMECVKHAAKGDALHVLKYACDNLGGTIIGKDYFGFQPYSREVLDIAAGNICIAMMVFCPENCTQPPVGYALLHKHLLKLCMEAEKRYHIELYSDINHA